MAIYHIDLDNGNDTNTGLGWWGLDFTGGTGGAPAAGDTVTGATSGATATVITFTGTWGTSGILYLSSVVGTFSTSETLNLTGGKSCTNSTAGGAATVRAWKTITSGATAARIAPNDTVKVSKTTDPTSLGITAAWTDNSKTVTLASALTTNIVGGGATWVPSTNVTFTNVTTRKEGTNAPQLSIATAFTTGIAAYTDITTLNLSGYRQLSLWIRSNLAIAANVLRIDLCSDNLGATPVNSFTINVALQASQWYPITLNYGSALGSAIESVALFAISDPGAAIILLDNIIACKAPGNDALTLTSLIGKNTSGETFYPIQSINGTTVLIDNNVGTNADAGRGYSGTTETITTYKREPYKTTLATTTTTEVNAINDSGATGSPITFSGGWNRATNTQDGETWFDGTNGWGYGLYATAKSFFNLEKFGLTRYYAGLYLTTACFKYAVTNCHFIGCGSTAGNVDNIAQYSCSGGTFTNVISNNSDDSGINWRIIGTTTCQDTVLINCQFRNNLDDGIDPTGGGVIKAYNCTMANNGTVSVDIDDAGQVYLYNCNLLDATEIAMATTVVSGSLIASHRHDQTAYRFKVWQGYSGTGSLGIIGDPVSLGYSTAYAKGGSGLCICFSPTYTDAGRELTWDFWVPVTGGVAATVKFYITKTTSGFNGAVKVDVYDSHDNITKLVNGNTVPNASIPVNDGVGSDWTYQYSTPSFTPTDTGLCRVRVSVLDGSTAGDIFIDDLTVA